MRNSRPSTLTELKAVVEAFAESVGPEEVKRSARSTWNRARAYRAVFGQPIENSGGSRALKYQCLIKSSLVMTEKITLNGIKV